MGKFIDQKKIADDLTLKIMATVNKYAKSLGCNVGSVSYEPFNSMGLGVEVVNDGLIGSDLGSLLGKIDRVVIFSIDEFKGTYDWHADVYCRPSSYIRLAFQ